MEDSDMDSVVERLMMAISSQEKRNIFSVKLIDMKDNCTLACDGIPRLFIHNIAWILSNELKVDGPFRVPPPKALVKPTNVLAANGHFPLYAEEDYSSQCPYLAESLLKNWLQEVPGCVVDFTDDWKVRDVEHCFDQFSRIINDKRKMNESQRKIFALMVQLALCVMKHKDKTLFKTTKEIAPLFSHNIFNFDKLDDLALQSATPDAARTFETILDLTKDPQDFRRMFFTLFPSAPERKIPSPRKIEETEAAAPSADVHEKPAPPPEGQRVTVAVPVRPSGGAVPPLPPPPTGPAVEVRAKPPSASPPPSDLSSSLRRSRRSRKNNPRLDIKDILGSVAVTREGEKPKDDDDDDAFGVVVPPPK